MNDYSKLTPAPDGSMLQVGRSQVMVAGQHLGLDSVAIERFLAPVRTIETWVEDPREGGSVIGALRIQHNQSRGPAKGGVRFSQSVNREEVEALALFMTLKTAAVDLELGGGKGGVTADPDDFTDDERAALFEELGKLWALNIGPGDDVLGPDVGTGEPEMDALHRGWLSNSDVRRGTAATGKSLECGGLEFREGATARGLELVFDELEDSLDLGSSIAFAVHGYGSVGRGFAQRLIDRGHRLVAISDSGGGASDPDGLSLDELDDRKESEGTVSDGSIGSSEVLSIDCDLLVPAALQGVVDAEMAAQVRAGVIIEGANGPCTQAGISTLDERGIVVVPDILANSGGVTASFEEMVDPDARDSDEVIAKRFADRLQSAARQVWDRAESDGLSLRTAATMTAMERIV